MSYKKTLKQIEFDEEEYHKHLHLPNIEFVFRTVEQIVQILGKDLCSIPRISSDKVEEVADELKAM